MNDFKKELDLIKNKLLEIERKIDDEKYHLYIRVSITGSLTLEYIDINDDIRLIGYITNTGYVNMMSSHDTRNNYIEWLDYGLPFYDKIIEWRGGQYQIQENYDDIYLSRIDISDGGDIYMI